MHLALSDVWNGTVSAAVTSSYTLRGQNLRDGGTPLWTPLQHRTIAQRPRFSSAVRCAGRMPNAATNECQFVRATPPEQQPDEI